MRKTQLLMVTILLGIISLHTPAGANDLKNEIDGYLQPSELIQQLYERDEVRTDRRPRPYTRAEIEAQGAEPIVPVIRYGALIDGRPLYPAPIWSPEQIRKVITEEIDAGGTEEDARAITGYSREEQQTELDHRRASEEERLGRPLADAEITTLREEVRTALPTLTDPGVDETEGLVIFRGIPPTQLLHVFKQIYSYKQIMDQIGGRYFNECRRLTERQLLSLREQGLEPNEERDWHYVDFRITDNIGFRYIAQFRFTTDQRRTTQIRTRDGLREVVIPQFIVAWKIDPFFDRDRERIQANSGYLLVEPYIRREGGMETVEENSTIGIYHTYLKLDTPAPPVFRTSFGREFITKMVTAARQQLSLSADPERNGR